MDIITSPYLIPFVTLRYGECVHSHLIVSFILIFTFNNNLQYKVIKDKSHSTTEGPGLCTRLRTYFFPASNNSGKVYPVKSFISI